MPANKGYVVRIGRHFVALRTSAMREYHSERNRLGVRVWYLPFGLRVAYRKDRRHAR